MGSCLSSDGSGGGGSSRSSSSAPSSPLLSPASKKGRSGGGTGRRRRPGGSSLDSEQQRLHKIPGRMFLNGASSVASLFTQQGKKGTNQDAMIVWEVRFSFLSSSFFHCSGFPFCSQLFLIIRNRVCCCESCIIGVPLPIPFLDDDCFNMFPFFSFSDHCV